MAGNHSEENQKLLAELEALKAQLAESETKRTEAEEMAQSLAAITYAGSLAQAHATGKTVKVKTCINPWERDKAEQKWETVEMPTYFYKIELPAGACGSQGSCLSTNGIEYHHGQIYEFTALELAEMQSRVARCWDHEKSIHGDNENAYRKPTNHEFITGAAAARRSMRH